MAFRRDVVSFQGAKRNSAGVLIAPASLSRTGVQVYKRPDGSEFREYRPESEVFAPAALESLRSAPVTIGHPSADVTEDTLDGLSVGLASDRDPTKTQRDGQSWLDTTLAISRRSAIKDAEAGKLVEISLGYDADVDPTPGTAPDGTHYDGVQRNIRVNHVALLPAGQARAGRQARLRLDGAEETCYEQTVPKEPTPMVIKIRLDGVEVIEGSAEHIALLNKAVAAAEARATAAEAATATAKADGVALKARADTLEADLATARKPVDVAPLIADELKFRDSAKALLPKDYAFDGKSRTQVMRDAIGAEACNRVDAFTEAERPVALQTIFGMTKPTSTPDYAPRTPQTPTHADAQTADLIKQSDAMFGRAHTPAKA